MRGPSILGKLKWRGGLFSGQSFNTCQGLASGPHTFLLIQSSLPGTFFQLTSAYRHLVTSLAFHLGSLLQSPDDMWSLPTSRSQSAPCAVQILWRGRPLICLPQNTDLLGNSLAKLWPRSLLPEHRALQVAAAQCLAREWMTQDDDWCSLSFPSRAFFLSTEKKNLEIK